MRGREGMVAASASQQGLSSKGSRAQTGQVGQQGGNHWTPAGGDSEGSCREMQERVGGLVSD